MLARHHLLAIALSIAVVSTAAAQSTWYVDDHADPNGVGTAWLTAFRTIQEALDVAVPGDEIRVGEGTYRPTALTDPNDPRSATFQLMNGVALRGGYAGHKNLAAPDTRDYVAYASVLSGNIGTGGDADNCYHVVIGSGTDATAILDGFTITAGVADGVSPADTGAGMYNLSGSPTILNCLFTANRALLMGGGMYNELDSSPTITDCVFLANDGGEGAGGMLNVYNSNPTLTNCSFMQNVAGIGGGMGNQESHATLNNCVFDHNVARAWAGAMYTAEGDATVTDCAFRGNSADPNEGAAGALAVVGGSPTFTNCRIIGNSAAIGGGLYGGGSGAIRFINCTLVGNAATGDEYPYGMGAAMVVIGTDPLELHNCIVWQNTSTSGPAIASFEGGIVDVRYSCTQDGHAGDGNITDDPLLADADGPNDVFGDDDGDVRLLPGSPCIDAGDSAAVPPGVTTDFEGDDRFADADGDGQATVDMGVDEHWIDCNENGEIDGVDIAQGTSHDWNGNSIPDECDDCNENGVADVVDIIFGLSADCNGNWQPDECDIAGGSSDDLDLDGVPDECVDCNANDIPDAYEIGTGLAADCNVNGVPDECDIDSGTSLDDNGNDIPDECEEDCNGNGIPDFVDVFYGVSDDDNNNGVPDECDPQCIGDLDGDDNIGLTDLAEFLSNYGATSGATYWEGDLDWDGDIDLQDLAELLGVYGTRCVCPGDFTGDGHVNLFDLAQMMGHYGATGAVFEDGDFDFDGDVDLYDLAGLLGVYGSECP
jgi:hypothetical protein